MFRGSPDDTKTAMAGGGNPGLAGLQLYFGLVFRIFLPLQKMLEDRSLPRQTESICRLIGRQLLYLFQERT